MQNKSEGFSLGRKILFFVLLIILGGAIFIFTKNTINEKENKYQELKNQSEKLFKEVVDKRISYIINKGEGAVLEYRFPVSEKATVFSMFQELSSKKNLALDFSDSQYGVFVKSIDGVLGGKDNKYWMYYVNGKSGEVAADKKEVNPGDKIEWKFEKPNF